MLRISVIQNYMDHLKTYIVVQIKSGMLILLHNDQISVYLAVLYLYFMKLWHSITSKFDSLPFMS